MRIYSREVWVPHYSLKSHFFKTNLNFTVLNLCATESEWHERHHQCLSFPFFLFCSYCLWKTLPCPQFEDYLHSHQTVLQLKIYQMLAKDGDQGGCCYPMPGVFFALQADSRGK